jgi:Mn-dependent DtxR family transcriptional regulator
MDGRLGMRHADRERLEAIFRTVEREPGIKAGKVARTLKIARSSVTRALPALEAEGMLLSEDGRGRLWPWGRRK